MNVGDRVRRQARWMAPHGYYSNIEGVIVHIYGEDPETSMCDIRTDDGEVRQGYYVHTLELVTPPVPEKFAVIVNDPQHGLLFCTRTGNHGDGGEIFESRQAALDWATDFSTRHRRIDYHLVPVRSIGTVTDGVFTEFE